MATIQGVYVALFGRPADPLGLAYFNSQTNNGTDLTKISALSGTAEYQDRFKGQNNTQIVNSIYQSLFGHDADLAGLTFFVNQLTTGAQNINTIAINILDGAQNDDKTIVTNKVAAADLYTKALDTGSEVSAYNGSQAAEQGRTFLVGVTTEVPKQEAVDLAVSQMVTNSGGGGTGATFTLTPGADFADQAGAYRNGSQNPFDFKFTSGNETVVASTTTLTAADSLIDSSTADQDRLNLTVTGNTASGQIKGLELVNLDVSGASAGATVNFANISGVHDIVLTGAPGGSIVLANLTNTGATFVDAHGLTSAVNGVVADFSASTSTAALHFEGGLAGDTFIGAAGADIINGGAGADTLSGNAGADTIHGGDGGDTIDGGTNNDTLFGDGGNDVIHGGTGDDTIDGGAGNDTITTDGGKDVVTGGAGDDEITLTTGAGNTETLKFGATAGDNGNDTIFNFTAGSSNGDKMDFTAFLGGPSSVQGTVSGAAVAPAGAGYTAAVGENTLVISHNATFDGGDGKLSLAELQASALHLGANAHDVIIYDGGADLNGVGGANDSQVYYVTTDVNGAFASVSLVGTLDGVVASDLAASNFA